MFTQQWRIINCGPGKVPNPNKRSFRELSYRTPNLHYYNYLDYFLTIPIVSRTAFSVFRLSEERHINNKDYASLTILFVSG